jgi:hypothetical protein
LFTAEAKLDNVVIPRPYRVHIIRMVDGNRNKRMFSLLTDFPLLEAKLHEIGDVALVIIDPESAYFGAGKVATYRTSDMRGVLAPLRGGKLIATSHNPPTL